MLQQEEKMEGLAFFFAVGLSALLLGSVLFFAWCAYTYKSED